jgi:hypothetical protein
MGGSCDATEGCAVLFAPVWRRRARVGAFRAGLRLVLVFLMRLTTYAYSSLTLVPRLERHRGALYTGASCTDA